MIRDVFKYALPLGASAIVGRTSQEIDKLYISYYFNPADFAIYRNGAMELPVFALFTASIFTVLLPEMSRLIHAGNTPGAIGLWREGVRRCAMITVLPVIFSFVFAEDVIRVVFSSRYAESVPVLRIYTARLLIRMAQYGNVFVVLNRTRLILAGSVFSLAITGGGGYLFIKLFPLIGLKMFLAPCRATLLGRYLRVIASLLVIAHLSGVRFRGVFPWGPIVRFLGCSVLGWAAAYPLVWVPALDSEGMRVLWLILAALVTVVGYLFTASLTRSISRSDTDFIFAPIRQQWNAWPAESKGRR